MSDHEMDDNVCKELEKRLIESENTYKVFGFSHIIIMGSVADIMDSSLRLIIDGMYRKTKSHCKTDQETESYRQHLCKLYLTYIQRGLTHIDCLEPKLANILIVKEIKPKESVKDRLLKLKTTVAERTKRLQSLIALQNRLKTDTVLAEWVFSKVEPTIHELEKDLSNIDCVLPNDAVSILSNLNQIKNSLHTLELN